ncbi:unnamed protein product [Victoria cruziana]
MEGSGEGEFLFCNRCGTMLSFDSVEYAACPLCKSRRSVGGMFSPPFHFSSPFLHLVSSKPHNGFFFSLDIAGKEICYTITNERFRRNVNLNQLKDTVNDVKKLEVNEPCPKCGNDKLEYYIRQLRSADEGHTVFYECPKCPYKHVVNT